MLYSLWEGNVGFLFCIFNRVEHFHMGTCFLDASQIITHLLNNMALGQLLKMIFWLIIWLSNDVSIC